MGLAKSLFIGSLAALLLLGAAPVAPPSKPEASTQATQAQPNAKRDGDQGLSAYERKSLAVDRAANRIAEAANRIGREQADFAFWQLVLGGFGVFFTGVAAFFAYRATHWAKGAAIESKRSADISERSLNSLERPSLLMEIVESAVKVEEKSIRYGLTKYRFRNIGRTPAIITHRHFALEHADLIPEAIDPLSARGRPVAYGVVIPFGDVSETFDLPVALSLFSHLDAVKEGRSIRGEHLFLIGFVRYRDLIGNEYATGFCFRHEGNEIGFQIGSARFPGETEDPYNYDRKLN